APAFDDIDDAETHGDGPVTSPRPLRTDTAPPPFAVTSTEIPAMRSVDLPFHREEAAPRIEPLPSLGRVPMPGVGITAPRPADVREAPLPASASPRLASPEVPPLSVEDYAAVKMAFWSKGTGSHAAVEDTLRELGIEEDQWRAGEERLLAQLADEAGR